MGHQHVTSLPNDFYRLAGAKNSGDGLGAFLTFSLQVLLSLIPDTKLCSRLGAEGSPMPCRWTQESGTIPGPPLSLQL